MIIDLLKKLRLRSEYCDVSSFAAIGLCLSLWVRAKTVDQSMRGNAERRAIFVGLWPPMLWLIGRSLEERETDRRTGR